MVETTLQSRHSGTCVSVELHYGCAQGGDGYSALVPAICGGMAEWLKALAWNACRLVRVSWVRIPLPPPPPHNHPAEHVGMQRHFVRCNVLFFGYFMVHSVGFE